MVSRSPPFVSGGKHSSNWCQLEIADRLGDFYTWDTSVGNGDAMKWLVDFITTTTE